MTSGTTHSNIWTELDAWAGTFKPWQRFVLERAVSTRALSAADIENAYDQLLKENGLRDSVTTDKKAAGTPIGRPVQALTKPLHLERIDNLAAVNAIADGSEIAFGPQLTIVYGRNGAGKSGFARLIANGCFSRSKPEILPNVYEEGERESGSAQFHVVIDGVAQAPITVKEGTKNSDLLRVAFFDVNVARQHVSDSSPFEFTPAGFDVFGEMGRVFQELAKRLAADIKSRTRATNFAASFIGQETSVSKVVAAISSKTNMVELEKLGTYGDVEAARLDAVNQQMDALKKASPVGLLASLRQTITDLDTLSAKLLAARTFCDGSALKTLLTLATGAKDAKSAADALGSDTFKRPFFDAVGTPEWQAFAKSAHALAKKEGANYPDDNSRCLLCERPFEDASRAHVSSLLSFVEGDAQKKAASALGLLAAEVRGIEQLDGTLFAEGSRAQENVSRASSAAVKVLIRVTDAVKTQKDAVLAALRQGHALPAEVDLTEAVAVIDALRTEIESDIARLSKDETDKILSDLALEHQTLRHRNVLSQLMPEIRNYVGDLAWCEGSATARAALNTRPITEKEGELVGRVFGKDYADRLAQECDALECDMPIKLKTSGQKGQTIRSLSIGGSYHPDQVLSEGEQKAVALADFLTEVGLNPASAGIVLDDPVTSQDQERKKLIASRLVAEAEKRQVIVFTHDLPFLNDIIVKGEDAGLNVTRHWIQKIEGKPGFVVRDDAPTTGKTYDNTLRAKEWLERAKKAVGTPQQDAIEAGMSALRRTVEETIVKKLFKGAIPRWSDRIIVTKLREIQWDEGACDELVAMFEELSALIVAHSHTDEASEGPLQIEDLTNRIVRVDALIKRCQPQRNKG